MIIGENPQRFKISMPASALVNLNDPAYLLVDAGVNFLVRPENIHDAFVVDQFFDNESRDEETDEIRTRYQGPKVGCLVLNFELLRVEDFLQGELNLVLQVPLAGGLDQTFFDQFHRDPIGQLINIVTKLIDGVIPLGLFLMIEF